MYTCVLLCCQVVDLLNQASLLPNTDEKVSHLKQVSVTKNVAPNYEPMQFLKYCIYMIIIM